MPCAFKHVHLEIHSTIEGLDLVQAVTEHITRRLSLDEDASHWTTLAVRETVMNAIMHGNESDPDKLVFVDFTATPEGNPVDLLVCVRDQGAGFDPLIVDDPLAPENMLRAEGRGIFLIRQFMDDVSMRRAREGGMEVRMMKRIHTG